MVSREFKKPRLDIDTCDFYHSGKCPDVDDEMMETDEMMEVESTNPASRVTMETDEMMEVESTHPASRITVATDCALQKYLSLDMKSIQLILKHYVVVISQRDASLEEDSHTIQHVGCCADAILVVVDSGMRTEDVHVLPYRRGWFIADRMYADESRYNAETGILECTYAEKNHLRDRWGCASNINTLVDRLASNPPKKEGVHMSVYVRKISRKIVGPAIVKVGAEAMNGRKYNRLGGIAKAASKEPVVFPSPRYALSEASGCAWDFADKSTREKAQVYFGDSSGTDVYFVGDMLCVPPKWMKNRVVFPVGSGKCVIPQSYVVSNLNDVMEHYVNTVALGYGGSVNGETRENVFGVIRHISTRSRPGPPPGVVDAHKIIRNCDKGLRSVSSVELKDAPPCVQVFLNPDVYGSHHLVNKSRLGWCSIIGCVNPSSKMMVDIEDIMMKTVNAHRWADIKKQIDHGTKNKNHFPCSRQLGIKHVKSAMTCPYQCGGSRGDNVRSCARTRKFRPGFRIDYETISPAEVWMNSTPAQ